MRVTGGVLLNRRVECPPGIIRPSMDRMRESLFSIMNCKMSIDGSRWLDLFAGSGIISIEAISRGASVSHLVELDRGKREVIKKNLEIIKSTKGSASLFIRDALKYLEQYKGESYNVIYADPPFPMKGKELMLSLVANNTDILKNGSYFIIHIPEEDLTLWKEEMGNLRLIDVRHYGRSTLVFYQKKLNVLDSWCPYPM